MADLVFDIETGPLPWEQIAPLYVPPAALPPWDESMVKYGNAKDPAKRAEKLAEVKAAYTAKLAGEKAELDADRCKWASEAALSPVTGQILAIGFRKDDKTVIVGESETEPEILEAFWNIHQKYAKSAGHLVGYCSNFFDVPFIVWRSYVHNIRVPDSVWDKTGRFLSLAFVDLMDRLPKRGFLEQSRKLTDVCKWLGLGAKPDGVDGGDFARLWAGNAESRQQALAYLENDLDMTWRLAERMGVV